MDRRDEEDVIEMEEEGEEDVQREDSSDESDCDEKDSDEDEYLEKYGEQYEKDFPSGRNTKHSKKYMALQKSRKDKVDDILKVLLNETLAEAVIQYESAETEYGLKNAEKAGKEIVERKKEKIECKIEEIDLGLKLFQLDSFRSEESPDKNILDKNDPDSCLAYYQGVKFKVYMSNLVETAESKKKLAEIRTRMEQLDKHLKKVDDDQGENWRELEEKDTEMILCAEELGMDFDEVYSHEEQEFLRLFPRLTNQLKEFRKILRKERRLVKKENAQFAKKDFDKLEVARQKLDEVNWELVNQIRRIESIMHCIRKNPTALSKFDFYKLPKVDHWYTRDSEEGQSSSHKIGEPSSSGSVPPSQKKPRLDQEEAEQANRSSALNETDEKNDSGEGTSSG